MPTGKRFKVTKQVKERFYNWHKVKGLTRAEACEKIGISTTTYQKYRQDFERYFRVKAREATGKPTGRPPDDTKIKEEDLDLENLKTWVQAGFDNKTIAKMMHISEATLYNYKQRFPAFRDILDNHRKKVAARVLGKMLERAEGYTHDSVHISNYQGEVTQTPIKKHYPPDVEAQRLILANNIGFVRDAQPQRPNNKGAILETLEMLTREDGE